ncbi:unnamed protein product, partial [Linum tenue]
LLSFPLSREIHLSPYSLSLLLLPHSLSSSHLLLQENTNQKSKNEKKKNETKPSSLPLSNRLHSCSSSLKNRSPASQLRQLNKNLILITNPLLTFVSLSRDLLLPAPPTPFLDLSFPEKPASSLLSLSSSSSFPEELGLTLSLPLSALSHSPSSYPEAAATTDEAAAAATDETGGDYDDER